jgi:ribA/ribD-fused uncharacterized protein
MAIQVTIGSFQGEFRWLSNFWPAQVTLDGRVYPSVEHAYQAAKTKGPEARKKFQDPSLKASVAKRLGSPAGMLSYGLRIRPDWNEVRLGIMEGLIRQKFSRAPLRDKLLATGDAILVEGNYWNDQFWGVCRGVGENHLGKILMKIRKELQDAYSQAPDQGFSPNSQRSAP